MAPITKDLQYGFGISMLIKGKKYTRVQEQKQKHDNPMRRKKTKVDPQITRLIDPASIYLPFFNGSNY